MCLASLQLQEQRCHLSPGGRQRVPSGWQQAMSSQSARPCRDRAASPAALGPCQNHWITGRTGHSQAGLLLRTLALLHKSLADEVRPSSYAKRTRGLVAMTSAQHAEGRQFDPGWVYLRSAM